MEHALHHQIQTQDEYREKQNALAYLIKIMGNLSLENLDTLGPGFDFMETRVEESSNGEPTYGIPKKTKAYEYLQKVQDDIEDLSPENQLKTIKKLLEENYGMYKAAVKTTENLEKQVAIKVELIEKEVKKNRPLIEKANREFDELILEKDYLLLQDAICKIDESPEIRIKNQLSEGTVIVGKNAKLVLDKTIYGVKLREIRGLNSKDSKIVIEGYFD